MKRAFGCLLSLVLLAAAAQGCFAQSSGGASQPSSHHIDETFVIGRVKQVSDPSVNSVLLNNTGMVSRKQLAEIEILEGPLKGKTFTVPNEITDNPAYNVVPAPGKELVLSVVTDNNKDPEINIADYHRVPTLAALLAVFLAVFLYFGGKDGIKSLAGLGVGMALIGFVLLPLSFHGFNPLLTASLICLAVTVTTTTLVGGFSRKAAAAILGTVGGVIISGISAQLVISTAPLTGLSTEEAQILRGSVLNQPAHFYTGLLAAGMLIGALGVIMDVAVSIASAVNELSETNAELTRAELYKKGMNVGRDIMGTMTNTLILAYAGSALPLLLLTAQIQSVKLLNLDLVATEIASALTGSLGLICTIPLTALAASTLLGKVSHPKTAVGADPLPEASSKQFHSTQEAEFEKLLMSTQPPTPSKKG